MSIYLNGKTYWVRIYHNGQCIRESTGFADKKNAQRVHDEIKAKRWTLPRQTGVTWSSALIKWLEAKPRSDSDRYALRSLAYADRPLSQCTVRSFQDVLGKRGMAPSTYNRYVARIAAVMNLSGVKLKFPRKPTTPGRLRFLTEAEWSALYKELPAHLKALALFSVKTGLRRYNVTHLTWQAVDIERRLVWVHADEAKGGKVISVPLSDDALEVLKAQQGQHEVWVFPWKGKPIVDPKTGFQSALRRAKIKDFTWHGLRHTWASWHIMAGTPLEVLQKLGGWEDTRMVLRYAHLEPGYLAQYANNARPWRAA